jgi:putative peptide zinc metalloprotease protein
MGKNYFRRGRMPDMKRNRVAVTSTIIATLVALILFLPLPISRIKGIGLIQLDREALSQGKVTVPDQGILEVLHVQNGDHVYDGQLLAEFRSLKLDEELNDAQQKRAAALASADTEGRNMISAIDPDEKKKIETDRIRALKAAEEQASRISVLQKQIGELRSLRAPCTGIVMEAPKKDEVGKLWEKEQPTPFCVIGDAGKLQVLIPVSADDYHLLQKDTAGGKSLAVTMRVPGRGMNYIYGKVTRLPEQDAKDIPVQLTHRGGGSIAVKPGNDPRVNQPQSQVYLVEIQLDEVDPHLLPGTMVQTKVHCQWMTCGKWVWRKVSALFDLGLI